MLGPLQGQQLLPCGPWTRWAADNQPGSSFPPQLTVTRRSFQASGEGAISEAEKQMGHGWGQGVACLPDTPVHGFLQLMRFSLSPDSSVQEAQGRALWLVFSKELALLQNRDINSYLARLLLKSKSIHVKALRDFKHTVTVALVIRSFLIHKI